MRKITLLCYCLCLLAIHPGLYGQVTLLEQNFNTCIFPADWQVKLTGNPTANWYVGLSQNPKAQGQSIDGTCFLFIDDDINGAGTPSYVLEFVSPAFDVTPYQTVECTMDVHFRFGENDFIQILATDGVTETELARFDNYMTNEPVPIDSDYFSLKHDLSLVSTSANTRLIIRYTSPPNSEGHYAGIDNIKVTGSGTGANVIREGFNFCQKPAGWQTQVLSGQGDWKFGRVPLGSSAFYSGNSMDGSCFVFFDDDAEGETAPPSAIRLISPWFAGSEFYEYELNFDALMRYSGAESFTVSLENNLGAMTTLFKKDGHVGGPFFPQYEQFKFDLSPYRAPQLRLIFEYSDGGLQGYWTGVDNVKVTGKGAALDFCDQSEALLTGGTCQAANNKTALLDGPPASCSGRIVGNLWYHWLANFTGVAKFTTNADFNDVVQVFVGDCANLQPVYCNNRDEHGFTGEASYFPAQAGITYYLRVSGQDEGFGISRGSICPRIEQVSAYPPTPANDDCASAIALTANGPCPVSNNRNAGMSAVLPSLNALARADVWFKFTAANLPANERYEVRSNADFSEIITVYRGGCTALQEVAGNHKGGALELPVLNAGETYWVQIAGNFATVEGGLCPQLLTRQTGMAPNDLCPAATLVPVGGQCVAGNNDNASFSGHQPSCAVSVDRDVWFKFTAPAFGSVHVNTGAEFEHTLAVWQGDCDNLNQIYCALNPKRCDGYVTVANLNSGQTYYLQIASWNGPGGLGAGDVCVQLLSGDESVSTQAAEITILQPCVGMDSVRLGITISGGAPPFTFSGNSPGQILNSGQQYVVIATDSRGCEQFKSGIVKACASNECTMVISMTPEYPTCYGGNNGSLTAAVNGGTGPFQFKWSNGTPTAKNSNLSAGTYTLTVVDANGCDLITPVVLPQPDSIQTAVLAEVKPHSGLSNGSLDVQVTGGTPPYSFTWMANGTVFSTGSEDLGAAPGGLYELHVADSNGCTSVFPYLLMETVGALSPDGAFYAELFPNPAQDKATLSVALPYPQTLGLHLTDIAGRTLRQWTVDAEKEQQIPVSLEHVPTGVYLLHIRAGQSGVAKLLVVGR